MNKLSGFLIGAGVVCMLLSGVLYGCNRKEALDAQHAANAVLPKLTAQIESRQRDAAKDHGGLDMDLLDPEMETVTVDGNEYIGYLVIPGLDLEMPILSRWSYENLKITANRYTGAVNSDDLVLMGHNYDRGFEELERLRVGDEVYFRDVNGVTTAYQVVVTDVLPASAVEEMVHGGFDLTLFTCTYGGQNRLTVRCERATQTMPGAA